MQYKALLSYPEYASVTVHFSNGTDVSLGLNDLGVYDFGSSGLVQPYHAYSPSGSAQAKVVFVNYGREEDYRTLRMMGVNVSGCVVLARKSGLLRRGGVVETAEVKGALGVLLYAEGDKTVGGVERGTVMRGIGDPLSPGWPGVEGGEALGFDDSKVSRRFPKIPSMPLSLKNAEIILGSLGGQMAPQEWIDSGREVWRVGPGPTMVNLTYQVGGGNEC